MKKPFKHSYNPIKRNISVAKVSWRGLQYALKNDAGVLQWIIICIALTPVAFWLGSDLEIPMMLGSLWMIFAFELMNTALEETLDQISTDYDERIGLAKDMASAAVFFVGLIALAIWLFCLFN